MLRIASCASRSSLSARARAARSGRHRLLELVARLARLVRFALQRLHVLLLLGQRPLELPLGLLQGSLSSRPAASSSAAPSARCSAA